MNILTVTMNPALDTSTYAGFVVPKKKIRCESLSYAPGGGGINVSRALKKLGVKSTALFCTHNFFGSQRFIARKAGRYF